MQIGKMAGPRLLRFAKRMEGMTEARKATDSSILQQRVCDHARNAPAHRLTTDNKLSLAAELVDGSDAIAGLAFQRGAAACVQRRSAAPPYRRTRIGERESYVMVGETARLRTSIVRLKAGGPAPLELTDPTREALTAWLRNDQPCLAIGPPRAAADPAIT